MQVQGVSPSYFAMRDEHRPKQELIHEITGLRKQVVDLKEAMAARRRVEEALRGTAGALRSLADGAPVGLGLFRSDGTLLTANQPLARMLGYGSPSELLALGAVFGVFASLEQWARTVDPLRAQEVRAQGALFRCKDGRYCCYPVIAAGSLADGPITLAVLDHSVESPNNSTFPALPA